MENVLVIGAARSGVAVSRLLVKMGYHVLLTDQKEILQKNELESLGIEVYEKGHPDSLKERQYAFLVKNPGIPYTVLLSLILLRKRSRSIRRSRSRFELEKIFLMLQ